MESACGVHQHPKPLLSSLTFFKPLFPFSISTSPSLNPLRRRPLALRASHNHPISKALEAASSILKPAVVAATFAAALLLSRHSSKAPLASLSVSPSISTQESQTVTDQEKEKSLESHLASNPDDVQSLRALMELKVKARKLPEAVAIVDRLLILEPGEKDLPLLKAHLQSYSGDAEGARRGFEDILAADPFVVEAYHGLVMTASLSQEDDDLDGVLQRVEDVMELCKKEKRKEDLRDFRLLVAQVKVIEGEYEEALKIYEELVKEEPRDFRPYLCQGIVYTLMRKKDDAVKQFEKYQRLVPKGHPYAQYFEQNMMAMNALSQMGKDSRKDAVKN